mgnify:FL=1
MKKYYKEANVPVADYRVLHTLKDGLDFAKQVGYPLVMNPIMV